MSKLQLGVGSIGWSRLAWMVLLGVLLSGCAAPLPRFDNAVTPQLLAPRVSTIVQEIQCEILEAVKMGEDPKSPLSVLQREQFVVSVDLTLDVTNRESLNPSLGYIHPYATAGNNFTLGLNGQLTGEQHRNLHLTFALLVDQAAATDKQLKECHEMRKGSSLQGDLGIVEIIGTGLPYQGHGAYVMRTVGIDTDGVAGLPDAVDPPGFGSTVDFTLVYGAGGGPNWTLTYFKGVDEGLASFLRTNKDTLVLAFVKVAPKAARPGVSAAPASAASAAIQAAGRAAQNQLNRQILNRLSNIR